MTAKSTTGKKPASNTKPASSKASTAAAAKSVAKPVARSVAKTVAKSVANPAAKTVARPVAKSTARLAAKVVVRPVAGKAASGKTAAATSQASARQQAIELENHALRSQIEAIGKAMGVIEFTLDGKVTHANQNFLDVLGYTLDEIRGQHHSLFVDPAYRASAEYRLFWDKLGRGEYDAGQYKRIGKAGREVWIEASYNPIIDAEGKPCKVIKYATDITEGKLRAADFEGQLAAIGKAQGVIEFTLDGKVISANPNFLAVVGYTLEEIRGQHHSLFVDAAHRASPEYRLFWDKLGRGEYDAGQYRRIAKGGREVWLEASYNPIMDMNGRPFKVVKYATDVT